MVLRLMRHVHVLHQVCDSTAAARLCRVMRMTDSSRMTTCPGLVPRRIMTQG